MYGWMVLDDGDIHRLLQLQQRYLAFSDLLFSRMQRSAILFFSFMSGKTRRLEIGGGDGVSQGKCNQQQKSLLADWATSEDEPPSLSLEMNENQVVFFSDAAEFGSKGDLYQTEGSQIPRRYKRCFKQKGQTLLISPWKSSE
jgi:hypothetical protein